VLETWQGASISKCHDFWVLQWRQVLLGPATNRTTKIFLSLWETLLTSHTALEREERSLKLSGGFPALPMQEQMSFFPQEIYSPSTQPFGSKKQKSLGCVGWQKPCPTSAAGWGVSARLLTRQGQVPRRKGLAPSWSCQAQGREASCRLQITVPGGCPHASCCCCKVVSRCRPRDGQLPLAQSPLPTLPGRCILTLSGWSAPVSSSPCTSPCARSGPEAWRSWSGLIWWCC